MIKNLRDINQLLNSCSYKLQNVLFYTNLSYTTGISCFLQSPKFVFEGLH